MRRKLQFLQMLRALAALLVVGDHIVYYLASKQYVAQFFQNLAWFSGTFGVDIFFVISGFIISCTSRPLFNKQWGASQFAYRRTVRIVPLYWLVTIIAILLLTLHRVPSNFEIFSSLMFLPVVTEIGQPLRPILGVGWTLNLEVFFYALFTISLLFSRRLGIFLLVVVLTILVAAGGLLKPLSDTTDPVTTATFLSNPIMLLFAAGVLLETAINRHDGLTFQMPFAGLLSVVLVGAGIVIFIGVVDQAPWPLSWEIFFWVLCIAIVFFAVVAPEQGQSRVVAMLELLGDGSYSIYLSHFIVIAAVGWAWQTGFGSVGGLLFVMCAFVAAGGGGVLIHLWVERPLLLGIRHMQPLLSSKPTPLSEG
jgi:exopolysaccharide production protein ExoZ